MDKYRIVQIEKKGCYKYYAVEQRLLLVFWTSIGGAFDTDAEGFWRDTEHFPMSLQGALSYYATIIPDKYDWSIKQDHPTK